MFASVEITKHGFVPAPRKMCVFGLKKGEIVRRVSSSKCVDVLLVCPKPERRVVRCMMASLLLQNLE